MSGSPRALSQHPTPNTHRPPASETPMEPQTEQPTVSRTVAGWMNAAARATNRLVGNEGAASETETLPEQDAAPASMLDRLWAAAAHLGPFFGFWLLAPLVVYLLKRNGSAFARWHSYQALVLTLWSFFYSVLAALFAGFAVLVGLVLDKLGFDQATPIVLLVGVSPLCFVVLFAVLMSSVGGLKALRGKPWTMPIIGRIARGRLRRATA
ncbi:MAG TPA: DUF4870 domain-containing protein [Nannocystaceae bacterium]|nr:DUF4870 domain-containing protein [Nannocystaceae bacterium]